MKIIVASIFRNTKNKVGVEYVDKFKGPYTMVTIKDHTGETYYFKDFDGFMDKLTPGSTTPELAVKESFGNDGRVFKWLTNDRLSALEKRIEALEAASKTKPKDEQEIDELMNGPEPTDDWA